MSTQGTDSIKSRANVQTEVKDGKNMGQTFGHFSSDPTFNGNNVRRK
jgi:hypothetical protein